MRQVLHPDVAFDQVVASLPDGREVILVRVGARIHGWLNRCPHARVGLDWGDGRCLDGDGSLVCHMHGARFASDTGLCTDGPCRGERLRPVEVEVVDGRVVLA